MFPIQLSPMNSLKEPSPYLCCIKVKVSPLSEFHRTLNLNNLMYHDSVLKTESAPTLLTMTIKSIVGHRSTALSASDLELQMVKLSDIILQETRRQR
jgi:hypothetical protein